MNKKKMKFAVGSGVIVLTVVYLVITGVSKTSTYFLSIAELEASRSHSLPAVTRSKTNAAASGLFP